MPAKIPMRNWQGKSAMINCQQVDKITKNVLKRRDESLRYALAKALRRGLRSIPVQLEPFIPERYKIAS